jgi:mono/diheme cytochrome c family protein
MTTRTSANVVVFILALASSLFAQTSATKVTPVTGESWLSHLHRSFDETSMGKTGRLGPAELEANEQNSRFMSVSSGSVEQTVTLHGADLYRFNCRGCHGEAGLGDPPEINSVVNPVRAGSVTLILERMKQTGMSMSRADAAQLAKQSQDVVLHRLHKGGQDMPSFPHLSETEIRSLVAYLKQLADVPGAQAEQSEIRESSVRIGEHIAKSTCHICHSASGPNPDPQQLADGAIPPLSTLTSRVNQAQFVRKITRGAPIVMGTPALLCRGRMPVFYYLSEQEAADVYLYLSTNKPYQFVTLEPATATVPHDQGSPKADPPVRVVNASETPHSGPAKPMQTGDPGDIQPVALAVAGVLVSLLLVGAFNFTVLECMRLSAIRKAHELATHDTLIGANHCASMNSR